MTLALFQSIMHMMHLGIRSSIQFRVVWSYLWWSGQ